MSFPQLSVGRSSGNSGEFPQLSEILRKDQTPEKLGPGYWFRIHTKGKNAKTIGEIKDYIRFIKEVEEEFPCDVCTGELKIYVKNNPIENYVNLVDEKSQRIGMFTWSWQLHNDVNIRLGKPRLDFETCYNLYGGEKCHKINCNKP